MKKFCHLTLSLLLALSLMACRTCVSAQDTTTYAALNNATNITEESEEPLKPEPGHPVERLTHREELMSFYGITTVEEFGNLQDDDGWIYFVDHPHNNCFYKVNMNHLYPDLVWTLDDIAQSYLNGTAPWLKSDDGFSVLWSQDFDYMFSVKNDGWLYIDLCDIANYKSLPIACHTYPSLDPVIMAEAYQSGEWDGSPAWSENYRTCVVYDDKHTGLTYKHYDNCDPRSYSMIPEARDESLAYIYPEVEVEPWWRTDQCPYRVFEEYRYGVSTVYGYNVKTARVRGVYPDLPGCMLDDDISDETDENVFVMRINKTTFVKTPVEIRQFSKGELINKWDITSELNDFMDHFYTSPRLV